MMGDDGMFWLSGMGTPGERTEVARIKAENHTLPLRVAGLSLPEGAPKTAQDF